MMNASLAARLLPARSDTPFGECLFCLEGALLKFAGLEPLFRKPLWEEPESYRRCVKAALADGGRKLVTLQDLEAVRKRFPIRMGVMSLHSREWLDAVMAACWPGFEWDFQESIEGVVTFARGMQEILDYTWRAVIAGKSQVAARCHANRVKNDFSVLATWGWESVPGVRGEPVPLERWQDVSIFADAQIDKVPEIFEVLENLADKLPLLERLLSSSKPEDGSLRILKCRKSGFGGSVSGVTVSASGATFRSAAAVAAAGLSRGASWR